MNQFADWGLLTVANDCFLSMEAVHEFDTSRHGQYAARRNERDDAFDVGQVRTYTFAVDLERLAAASKAITSEDSRPVLA